jgi:uncharacterized membrane protein
MQATVLYVMMGVLFAVLGTPLALRRVPPNRWYGFRTPKTLSTPEVWYAANRITGIDMCIGGMVIALGALVLASAWSGVFPGYLVLADTALVVLTLAFVVAHGFLALRRITGVQ